MRQLRHCGMQVFQKGCLPTEEAWIRLVKGISDHLILYASISTPTCQRHFRTESAALMIG